MPKRKPGRKYGTVFGPGGLTRTVCKWCGSEKRNEGESLRGVMGCGGGTKRVCANPDCPRKGQVPWVVPIPQRMRRQRPDRSDEEDDPGRENAVRAMEDGCE